MNGKHHANRLMWDAQAPAWATQADERGTWRTSHLDPALVPSPQELLSLHDLQGKEVCVLGSGDNEVAFALAGMGAKVTSVDICERRLEIARGEFFWSTSTTRSGACGWRAMAENRTTGTSIAGPTKRGRMRARITDPDPVRARNCL